MFKRPTCSLCECPFRVGDVICDSPIYGDKEGVFHRECMKKVDAIIEEQGTNDVVHIFYPGGLPR